MTGSRNAHEHGKRAQERNCVVVVEWAGVDAVAIDRDFKTIAVILAALWLLGLLTSYTLSGLIHAPLLIAILIGGAFLVFAGKRG